MLRTDKLCILPLVGSTLLAAPAVTLADEFHSWTRDYYRENTACSVAEIASVSTNRLSVTVNLTVEATTADALADIPDADRDNWMALHCPSQLHPAWKENSPEFDIRIVVNPGSDAAYSLSCAAHYDLDRRKTRQIRDTILARLKQLVKRNNDTTDD